MTTILVPLDGSTHSDQILALVRSVARSGSETEDVHLLRVIPPFSRGISPSPEQEESSGEHVSLRTSAARRHMERLEEELRSLGLEVSTSVILGEPAEAVMSTAERVGASMIALATHGRAGPERWVRGSAAETLLREARIPLLLLNPEEAGTRPSDLPLFGRILVALDGSAHSIAILPHVSKLARDLRAEVTILHCLETLAPGLVPTVPRMADPPAPPGLAKKTEASARLEHEAHRDALMRAGVVAKIRVERGVPAKTILRVAADEDVDLIALTTRGQSGVGRLVFGSTAESVIRNSPRPVLVLRPHERGPAASREAKDLTAHEYERFPGEAEVVSPG